MGKPASKLFRSYVCAIAFAATAVLSVATKADHEVKSFKAITFAKPKNIALTLDIYVPQTGKPKYPVLIINHGGGWLINNNAPMTAMSEYIASKGEYIVANMNYRLLPDNNNTTTLNEMVEDVFGGVLWVKDHIAEYGGDPTKIAVTGDSAGGQLTSMILLSGKQLSSKGFAGKPLGFNPSYLPKGMTAEQVAAKDGLQVQAAVISYGAFDLYDAAKNGFEKPSNFFWMMAKATPRGIFGSDKNPDKNPELYKAVSPVYLVPEASKHKLPPQFIHVGSRDTTTPPAAAKHYVELLQKAGQPVEFKIYENRSHAFLDGGCNQFLNTCFDKDAPDALADIIAFLDKTLK